MLIETRLNALRGPPGARYARLPLRLVSLVLTVLTKPYSVSFPLPKNACASNGLVSTHFLKLPG